jgi:cysteinyl-tRNA synthetase
MANVWMHNGFLQVEGDKMSKSLGNFVTIREMLTRWNSYSWPGEALRFNMLRTHYRQPIDWTLEGLDEAHKILWSWYEGLTSVQPHSDVSADVIEALSDDLNTPQMISVLHGLHRSGKRSELRAALSFLGFSGDREQLRRTAFLEASGLAKASGSARVELLPPSNDDIAKLVTARTAARARKDFKESDRIRDELAGMGVVLKDGKDADGKPITTWEVAR